MLTELTLIFGLATTHIQYNDHYNNDNELVMIQVDKWTAGTMINSFNYRSYLAGYDFQFNTDSFDYGLMVGGVTGYDKDYSYTLDGKYYTLESLTNLKIMPMAAPYIQSNFSEDVNIRLTNLGTAFNIGVVVNF